LRPLFSTVVRQIVGAVFEQVARTGHPVDPPVLVVLDEAANIAPVEDLATIASTAAAMGLQLVTIFQDLAQIRQRYGEATGTVVNNHRATLFLPGIKCVDTLELASRLIGEHEIDRDSITTGSDGRRSNTTAAHWRRLLPAELARTMQDRTGVLVYGNLPPVPLHLRPWYRNRRLRRRASTEPPAEPAVVADRPELPPPSTPPRPVRRPRGTTGESEIDQVSVAPTPQLPLPPNVSILDVARARLRRDSTGGNA
jgi:type IV secretion system protein VirD4